MCRNRRALRGRGGRCDRRRNGSPLAQRAHDAAGAVQGRRRSSSSSACAETPRLGARRAQQLLDATANAAAAAAIFRRYTSPEAQLGLAFAQWTGPASLDAREGDRRRARRRSRRGALNLGWADYQAGRNADAVDRMAADGVAVPRLAVRGRRARRAQPGRRSGTAADRRRPAAVPAKARPDLAAGVHAWDLKARRHGAPVARRCRAARARRARDPRRRCGRALLSRGSARAVPAPRPAHGDVPARLDRAAPPRRRCSSGRSRSRRGRRSCASPPPSSRARSTRSRRGSFSRRWVGRKEDFGPNGL